MADTLVAPRSRERGPEPTPAARGRQELLAALLVAVPALILGATAVARYLNGHGGIDLAVFDQALWGASRGRSAFVSLIQESLLGDHFGPGLFVFAPLYRIAATPVWLLVGQAVAAAAAAWLVTRRLLARMPAGRAGLVGAALLCSPPVAYALLFDVHGVVFSIPFALAAVFAIEDGRTSRALLFGLLAASFRVEIGLAVLVAFLIWPGAVRPRRRAIAGLGAYLMVAVLFERALGEADYWSIHYGHLGQSPADALLHPGALVRTVLSGETLGRALPWLLAGALLCFRRPRLMVPAAVASLPVILSSWPGTGGIVFQYGFAPTFLLALAWVPTVRERPFRALHVVAGCAVLILCFGPFTGGLRSPGGAQGFLGQYWSPVHGVRCLADGLPDEAAISGRSSALTFLTHREHLYLWPYPFAGTPEEVLPAEHLRHGDPALAEQVDYLIVPVRSKALVPEGFVADGRSDTHLRYRRAATTTGRPADCRSARD